VYLALSFKCTSIFMRTKPENWGIKIWELHLNSILFSPFFFYPSRSKQIPRHRCLVGRILTKIPSFNHSFAAYSPFLHCRAAAQGTGKGKDSARCEEPREREFRPRRKRCGRNGCGVITALEARAVHLPLTSRCTATPANVQA